MGTTFIEIPIGFTGRILADFNGSQNFVYNSANLETDCDHARADFGFFFSFSVDNPI